MTKRYRKTYTPEALQFTHKNQIEEISTFLRRAGSRYIAGIEKPYVWRDELCHIIFECSCEYNCGCPRKPFEGEDWYEHGVIFEIKDWIVRGVSGCIYAVRDEIFKKTYEEVIDDKSIQELVLHPGQIIEPGEYVQFTQASRDYPAGGYVVKCQRQDYMQEECIGTCERTEGVKIWVRMREGAKEIVND